MQREGRGFESPHLHTVEKKEKKNPREALTIRGGLSKINKATDWCVRTYTTAVGLRPPGRESLHSQACIDSRSAGSLLKGWMLAVLWKASRSLTIRVSGKSCNHENNCVLSDRGDSIVGGVRIFAISVEPLGSERRKVTIP